MVSFNAIISSLQCFIPWRGCGQWHQNQPFFPVVLCTILSVLKGTVKWEQVRICDRRIWADLIQISCSLEYTCQGSIHPRKDDSTCINSPVYRRNDSHWGSAQAAGSMHAFSQLIKARGITDDSMLLQNSPSSASLIPHTSAFQQEGTCCCALQAHI